MDKDIELTETEAKIQHLDSVKWIPVLEHVVKGDTTLENEVNEFYQFRKRHTRFGGVLPEFRKEIDWMSYYESPGLLVDIVDGFYDEPLDKKKLIYCNVLNDYDKWSRVPKPLIRIPQEVLFYITGFSGVASMASLAGLFGALTYPEGTGEWKDYALISALSVSLCYTSFSKFLKYDGSGPHIPAHTNNEFQEYEKLRERAIDVDIFIESEYKPALLKRYVESKEVGK